MLPEITIFEVREFDPKWVGPVSRMNVQLTGNPDAVVSESDLKEIIASPSSRLFLLSKGEEIAGMLTLGIYKTPSGQKCWIEDVVIEASYRGQGLSKKMLFYVLDSLREQGISNVMLTSNPSRIEANHLYRSIGFAQRETNVYRMSSDKKQ